VSGRVRQALARPEDKKARLLQTVDGKNPAPPDALEV